MKKMKKMKFFQYLMMSLVLGMGFAACSDDEDDAIVTEPVDKVVAKARVSVKIETSDALRAIADVEAFYTALDGNSVDISNEVANAALYENSDEKSVNELPFPLDLDMMVKFTLKDGVKDSTYNCGYYILQTVSLLNKRGEVLSSGSFKKEQSWVPLTPLSEKSINKTIESATTLSKDADGGFTIQNN